MILRFIGEMYYYTVFTQMCMANITVQESQLSFTQSTPQNILSTVQGIHGQEWRA